MRYRHNGQYYNVSTPTGYREVYYKTGRERLSPDDEIELDAMFTDSQKQIAAKIIASSNQALAKVQQEQKAKDAKAKSDAEAAAKHKYWYQKLY